MPLTVKCGLDLQVRRRRIDARAMKASGRERVQRHVDNVKLSIVRYAALEEEPCLRAAETIFDTPCFAFLVRPLPEGNEVVVDSGGVERTGQVCEHMGAIELLGRYT